MYAKTKSFTIDGANGKLSAVLQYPDATEYPLVVIFHGFTAEKEMPLLKQIADNLEKKNIASIRFDFNGHGQSEGEFQDMTF